MRKLFLVRHGQTYFNMRKLIQGWCDSPLTELGIRQAETARERLLERGIRFDHACCSSSERACDTAEIILNGEIPYERRKDLREFHFGTLEAGSTSIIRQRRGRFDDFLVQFGGESRAGVAARMNAALTEIMLRPGYERVLAVSHGAAILEFLTLWQDESPMKVEEVLGNCTVYELDFDPARRAFACVDFIQPDVG